jgi:hypothetical protein
MASWCMRPVRFRIWNLIVHPVSYSDHGSAFVYTNYSIGNGEVCQNVA